MRMLPPASRLLLAVRRTAVRALDRQADVVADVADVEPAKRAAFVDSLGLPELKASRLLRALAGEVRR